MQRKFIPLIIAMFLALSGPVFASETYRLNVDGLACPFCAYGVEKKLKNTDGVEAVEIQINDGLVFVTVEAGATFDQARASQIIEQAGFTLRDFQKVQ
jgi:periplasmic mercuric ion binding protein